SEWKTRRSGSATSSRGRWPRRMAVPRTCGRCGSSKKGKQCLALRRPIRCPHPLEVPMLRELESVVLTCDLPEQGLQRGDVGTIVLVHGDRGYEVEFLPLTGETVAMVSLRPDQVRPVGAREITHARAVVPPSAVPVTSPR